MIAIGHRGARGHAPENTLAGIDQGILLGAPWLEIDVQLHQGALLLLHDLRLERTTNGNGRLADRDLAYLRGLDCGGGERMPTLDEALDRIDRRAQVNVELKTWNGCAAAVAECLHARLARGWQAADFLVSSFHHPELLAFKRRLPQVPIGVLYGGVPDGLAAPAQAMGAVAINVSDEFVDAALVADAHARGLKIFVYTVNHPDEIARMRAFGVDGVFSDYPDRVLASDKAA